MKHDKLIKLIDENIRIDRSDIELIVSSFEVVTVSKNELLEKENKVAKCLYFINSGFVRVFHIEEGIEITTQILGTSNFVTSFNSFITGSSANDNVKCVTQCELLRISKKRYNTLSKQSQKWSAFCKKIYERTIASSEERTKDILTLSAEKRYLKLISAQPEIIRNIPLQYIASYIGIKPESLSRIRRQVIS